MRRYVYLYLIMKPKLFVVINGFSFQNHIKLIKLEQIVVIRVRGLNLSNGGIKSLSIEKKINI